MIKIDYICMYENVMMNPIIICNSDVVNLINFLKVYVYRFAVWCFPLDISETLPFQLH